VPSIVCYEVEVTVLPQERALAAQSFDININCYQVLS